MAVVRLLVAAHLAHDETGAWPADASALAGRLGGVLPEDPFRPGAPLQFAVVGDEVRAWSAGSDGTDEGGTRARGHFAGPGDIVLTGPAHPTR